MDSNRVVYNLRMAQGTKCLHAIWNYMRKVKMKYQHVFGTNTGYDSHFKVILVTK